MSLTKSRPKRSQTHFFLKITTQLFPRKKVAQKCWLLLYFSTNSTKKNIRITVEHSPNLVALIGGNFRAQCDAKRWLPLMTSN
jgi:hypothetical protein